MESEVSQNRRDNSEARRRLDFVSRHWIRKVRMLERLANGYPLTGIEAEQFTDEIQEQAIRLVSWVNDFLQV